MVGVVFSKQRTQNTEDILNLHLALVSHLVVRSQMDDLPVFVCDCDCMLSTRQLARNSYTGAVRANKGQTLRFCRCELTTDNQEGILLTAVKARPLNPSVGLL